MMLTVLHVVVYTFILNLPTPLVPSLSPLYSCGNRGKTIQVTCKSTFA